MDANIRNKEFYKGKRVFITGDTGYKGAWLSAVLSELGANATGYALKAPEGSMFESIISDLNMQHIDGDVREIGRAHV